MPPPVQPLKLPYKFSIIVCATGIVFFNLETKVRALTCGRSYLRDCQCQLTAHRLQEPIYKFDYSKVYEWSYSATELYMTVFHNGVALDLVYPTTVVRN
jgi:hypothetical protein